MRVVLFLPIFLLGCGALFGQQAASPSDLEAVVTTDLGTFRFEFLPDKAPNHVAQFIRLARQGYYDGSAFFRVTKYPKPGMNGWGHSLMLIDPAGRVMPCHAAPVIPGMDFANARDHSLRWIWEESSAFTRFRGEDWMPNLCRSCERRERDFGGCRCQAFLLTGDAAATDPVCVLAELPASLM